MQELIQAKKPQTSSFENENEKGASMQPPVFQLKASETAKLQQPADEEAATAAPEGYVENVANLAVITKNFIENIHSKDIDWMLNTLEPIKHDDREIERFRDYFSKQTGQSIASFVAKEWSEEIAKEVEFVLGIRQGSTEESDIVATLHKYIEAKDQENTFRSMWYITDHETTSKLYGDKFPGRNLYTDIVALSNDDFDLTDMANKFFGKANSKELVRVQNEVEAAEARDIVARIYVKFGVEINSQKSLDTILKRNANAPEEMRKQLEIAVWTLADLRELEIVLGKYAAFLGEGRGKTKYADEPQELTNIGRINKTIGTSEHGDPYVTENIGGEGHYEDSDLSLFDSMHRDGYLERHQSQGIDSETKKVIDVNKRTPAGCVMTHEVGHLVMHRYLQEFTKLSGFWASDMNSNPVRKFKNPNSLNPEIEFRQSLLPNVEAPPTEYGCRDAHEDLAESISLYMNNRDMLQHGSVAWRALPDSHRKTGVSGNPCPLRFEFLKKIVDEMRADAKQ